MRHDGRRAAAIGVLLLSTLLSTLLPGCGSDEIRPVEIYPDDQCGSCRMAVSGSRTASELISKDGDVLKFDDLACFEAYRRTVDPATIAAAFVKEYESGAWIPYARSVIIRTSIGTPMGSGQVAVADQERARALLAEHPPTPSAAGRGGEGDDE